MTPITICIREFSWIPVCIQGSWWSPYAYGDRMTLIPVCIWGFGRCLYAYGDISVTNRMHNEIVSTWEIKSCIPIWKIMHMGISIRIWGSPYAYGRGLLKYSHMGITVRITKLCAYWEQHIHVLGSLSHQSIWVAVRSSDELVLSLTPVTSF